jgi:hypothetical protein
VADGSSQLVFEYISRELIVWVIRRAPTTTAPPYVFGGGAGASAGRRTIDEDAEGAGAGANACGSDAPRVSPPPPPARLLAQAAQAAAPPAAGMAAATLAHAATEQSAADSPAGAGVPRCESAPLSSWGSLTGGSHENMTLTSLAGPLPGVAMAVRGSVRTVEPLSAEPAVLVPVRLVP